MINIFFQSFLRGRIRITTIRIHNTMQKSCLYMCRWPKRRMWASISMSGPRLWRSPSGSPAKHPKGEIVSYDAFSSSRPLMPDIDYWLLLFCSAWKKKNLCSSLFLSFVKACPKQPILHLLVACSIQCTGSGTSLVPCIYCIHALCCTKYYQKRVYENKSVNR